MAGGGHIIIRRNMRAVADLEIVGENLTPSECSQRDAILAKQDSDWTKKEFAKLSMLVTRAHGRCT